MQEQFNLNWKTYSDHLKEMMEALLNSNVSADVTLVCNDRSKLKAHKFVLSACSPVFQSIINDMPQRENSFIYLRGVQSQEMKSILQFMYLGQATFYHDKMNEFLNVAKSFQIKEINKDVEYNDVDTFKGQENEENNLLNNFDIYDSSINQRYVPEDIGETDTKVVGYKNEAGNYQCGKCEKKFAYSCGLNRHSESAHEGVRYPCNKCNHTFTLKVNLMKHIKSVHEGDKFLCDLCDHMTARKDNLILHKKNKH